MLIYVSESCPVQPTEIQMQRPEGLPLEDSLGSISAQTTSAEGRERTTRMVDLALGLPLNEEDHKTIRQAWNSMHDNEQSLNQSLSYVRAIPLFLDIEMKKVNSARDPEVQLAIWAAALHRKREHHKWDTSMVMPGIVVNGDNWVYYLTFLRDDGLVKLLPAHCTRS